jgi:hypothetical protein
MISRSQLQLNVFRTQLIRFIAYPYSLNKDADCLSGCSYLLRLVNLNDESEANTDIFV